MPELMLDTPVAAHLCIESSSGEIDREEHALWSSCQHRAKSAPARDAFPAVIAHIGLSGYGIWAVVMATAGYMRFSSAE